MRTVAGALSWRKMDVGEADLDDMMDNTMAKVMKIVPVVHVALVNIVVA